MRGLLLAAAFIAVAFAVGLAFTPVYARADKVTVCHAAGQAGTTHFVTLEVPPNDGGYPQGHFTEGGSTAAGHEEDYLGPCLSPTPSPSPSATPSPSPSPTPTATPEASPSPTSTPSSTPSATPPSSTPPTATPDNRVMPPTDTDEGSDTLGALIIVLAAAIGGALGGFVQGRRNVPKG